MSKYRDYKHLMMLYPDDPTHVNAMKYLRTNQYDYAYILHDKDVWTEDDTLPDGVKVGDFKKPHWHVLVQTANSGTWNTALAKRLGIADNYIKRCNNIDKALVYFIHATEDASHKYQYSVDDVKGTLAPRLQKALLHGKEESCIEDMSALQIIDAIETWRGYIRLADFSRWCASNGLWGYYRQAGSLFVNMIKEHNAEHIQPVIHVDDDKGYYEYLRYKQKQAEQNTNMDLKPVFDPWGCKE